MKHVLSILAIFGVIGLSLSSEAVSRTPLLGHQYHTGYVPENRAYSMNCEIFSNYVKAEVKYLGSTTSYEQPVTLPKSLGVLIQNARKGVLTSGPAPADIGISIYYAYVIEPNDAITTVDLGSYVDSQFRTVNRAPEATELKEIIDTICSDFVPNLP